MAGYRSDTLSWASHTNEPDGDSHLYASLQSSYISDYFYLYQNNKASESSSNLKMHFLFEFTGL